MTHHTLLMLLQMLWACASLELCPDEAWLRHAVQRAGQVSWKCNQHTHHGEPMQNLFRLQDKQLSLIF